jgi:hypothetical protein
VLAYRAPNARALLIIAYIEAEKACREADNGSYLITINSKKEQEF